MGWYYVRYGIVLWGGGIGWRSDIHRYGIDDHERNFMASRRWRHSAPYSNLVWCRPTPRVDTLYMSRPCVWAFRTLAHIIYECLSPEMLRSVAIHWGDRGRLSYWRSVLRRPSLWGLLHIPTVAISEHPQSKGNRCLHVGWLYTSNKNK